MSKIKNYERILKTKVIDVRTNTLAKQLGISKITAIWFKRMIKKKQQEIIKNEITNLSTDDISQKLDIPLELAVWLKETIHVV